MAHAVLAHMMMWGGEWEAAIAEARSAVALNPNSAFVISMLGCVLGFGGYREEAFKGCSRQCVPAHTTPDLALANLVWVFAIFRTATSSPHCRHCAKLLACVRAMPELTNTSPRRSLISDVPDEAHEALECVPPQSAEQLRRWQQRPPWMRPEDYAIRVEGVRLAAGEQR